MAAKGGTFFQLIDLEDALQERSEVFVTGTGYTGVMSVLRETIDQIAAQGIEVKVVRTSDAVRAYKDLQGTRTVIAALHIMR